MPISSSAGLQVTIALDCAMNPTRSAIKPAANTPATSVDGVRR
jgi:hypothetical protein